MTLIAGSVSLSVVIMRTPRVSCSLERHGRAM
jgi:hypothetical protein